MPSLNQWKFPKGPSRPFLNTRFRLTCPIFNDWNLGDSGSTKGPLPPFRRSYQFMANRLDAREEPEEEVVYLG